MDRLGMSESGAKLRVANGQRNPAKVLAPKGKRVGRIYSEAEKLRRARGYEVIKETKEEVRNRQQESLVDYVLRNKPFYNDPFYKLALIAI